MTHNSFSNVDAAPLPGVQRLTLYNQEDSVTNQLRVMLFYFPSISFCAAIVLRFQGDSRSCRSLFY